MVAKKGVEPVVVVVEVVVVVVVVDDDDGFALVEFVFARDAAIRRLAQGVFERAPPLVVMVHAVVHAPAEVLVEG